MDPTTWSEVVAVQHAVRAAFGWSYEDDAASAEELKAACDNDRIVEEWHLQGRQSTLQRLKQELLAAKHVVLVGAAAEPTEVQMAMQEGSVVVAADGSVGACLPETIPLCVVTDLDGGVHLDQAAAQGIAMVVHAHGDNANRWKTVLDTWRVTSPPPLVLTHQTDANLEGMLNPGGFTDGDRALCFVAWLGVPLERIIMVGYDSTRLGRWSGITQPERKLEKLTWMDVVVKKVMGALNPTNPSPPSPEHRHK